MEHRRHGEAAIENKTVPETGMLRVFTKTVRGDLPLHSDSYILAVCLEAGSLLTAPDAPEGGVGILPLSGFLLSAGKEDVQLESGSGTEYLIACFDDAVILRTCLPALKGNQFLSDFFLHEAEEADYLSYVTIGNITPAMVSLLKLMEENSVSADHGDRLAVRGLFCELLRSMSERCYLFGSLKHQLGQESFQRVCACMLSARGQVSLGEVAEKCFCHDNTVARIIKRCAGMGYSRFRQMMRISFSAQLLRTGDITVREAAAECGYSNMSNFYRQFREVYGMSPGEYRELFL